LLPSLNRIRVGKLSLRPPWCHRAILPNWPYWSCWIALPS